MSATALHMAAALQVGSVQGMHTAASTTGAHTVAYTRRCSVHMSPQQAPCAVLTLGFNSSARAMASRCFWPPDSACPRSPTSVSYPLGSCRTNSSACAALAAARTCLALAPGLP